LKRGEEEDPSKKLHIVLYFPRQLPLRTFLDQLFENLGNCLGDLLGCQWGVEKLQVSQAFYYIGVKIAKLMRKR